MCKLTSIFSLTVLFLLTLHVYGQVNGCGGDRYLHSQFDVDTVENVIYGNNFDEKSNSFIDLKMNIFMPRDDYYLNRPVLILAFAGGFVGGTKEDINSICIDYASRGYVAATVDYRLMPDIDILLEDSAVIKKYVLNAMHDMKAAIRFFKHSYEHGNLYGIDSALIIAGGYSSGAISALQAGLVHEPNEFLPDVDELLNSIGGIEGTTNAFNYSSYPFAILSFSGAIDNLEIIDSTDPYVLAFHNEADQTVSYMHDQAFNMFQLPNLPYMYGPGLFHDYCLEQGADAYLKTIPDEATEGLDHLEYLGNSYYDTAMTWSTTVMHDLICDIMLENKEIPCKAVNIYPNPANDYILVNNESGKYHAYSIVNTYGQEILSGNLNNSPINIKTLHSGFYIMLFKGTGKIKKEQFLKI